MSDVKCPYCKTEQDINHEEGYGYSECEEHEQECPSCCRVFVFVTAISYSYDTYCIGGHDMEHSGFKDLYKCTRCDYYCIERNLKEGDK